ncbi:precorrin-3B C(17)-methyltransferase [Deinococcus maricopensis]|uniref:Precorrin-3B C17-methyltransferase n=1 Tax=Deinococcus maricopensis (strain DSM 21211 / LMG 22137 / NRRL B-23946 / LB-34) TaxID=709986 RepID=E8U434_DEIML|nr:precorrin-3B C(17)-methyltransferase [Deinococcus maricopensis]ADV65871.1 precorrin-3B C17-methyltransferase [Deinococcus maricopensis DSM 21211]
MTTEPRPHPRGKLYLVSVGPGDASLIPPLAQQALADSDAIVGYELYLRWIADTIEGKEIHAPPLTKERERAQLALDLARQGRRVSLVSSGDIGVYAMAALAFEELREDDPLDVQVIPGITAANACASLLGSPLSHDFATLSLSDLLCPWEWIETRAEHIARADLACVLYNVQSQGRREGVYKVLRTMLAHKRPDTVCGIVRNAYRPDQTVEITTLGDLLTREFDMLTSLVIGNRFTRRKENWMFTPRGYNDWTGDEAQDPTDLPRGAVWVFAGTSDGNALAADLAARGHEVVVSVATEYGRERAQERIPGVHVVAGRMGVEARRRLLRDTHARALVDATHPYATLITAQLRDLAGELSLPYLRYERPSTLPQGAPGVTRAASMEDAARLAARLGRRVFLATGSKDLATFLNVPGDAAWFARVTPQADVIDAAVRAGIPRANLLAMQGPFTRDFNESLWRAWNIDVVVTKDSGEAGGFPEKYDAARALGLPLIVVDRPRHDAAHLHPTFDQLAGALAHLTQETA